VTALSWVTKLEWRVQSPGKQVSKGAIGQTLLVCKWEGRQVMFSADFM